MKIACLPNWQLAANATKSNFYFSFDFWKLQVFHTGNLQPCYRFEFILFINYVSELETAHCQSAANSNLSLKSLFPTWQLSAGSRLPNSNLCPKNRIKWNSWHFHLRKKNYIDYEEKVFRSCFYYLFFQSRIHTYYTCKNCALSVIIYFPEIPNAFQTSGSYLFYAVLSMCRINSIVFFNL